MEATRTDRPARVLGGVRQSRTKDESVSPASQRKHIQAWADGNDGKVIKFTFDPSTSGGKSCFRRKGLGPYLSDPDLINAWDVLVITKLDRACRDTADYLKLREWCDRHGKRMVVLNNPALDNTTAGGRALGTMTAVFAEFEREMAKERNKDRYDEVCDQGRWPGGRIPFGRRHDKASGQLVKDDGDGGTFNTLSRMVDMAIAGKSHGQIREWLVANGIGTNTRIHDDEGKRTSERKQWTVESVRVVLRSQSTAELLGETKAAQLRAALRTREQTHGERVGGYMLLQVAFCRICKGPLYGHKSSRSYRCTTCNKYLGMKKLEGRILDFIRLEIGPLEYVKRVLVPGDDHQSTIHALEREIDTLEKISGTEVVIKAKQAEIDNLRSLPYDPDHYEPIGQGITVNELLDRLPTPGDIGSFLREYGTKIYADKNGIEPDLQWLYSLVGKMDIRNRTLRPVGE